MIRVFRGYLIMNLTSRLTKFESYYVEGSRWVIVRIGEHFTV